MLLFFGMQINAEDFGKVTVIIPTFNRFECLLNAVSSVLNQTYENIEIIVVNDCSTDERYYTHDFGKEVKVVHKETNSKKIYGFGSASPQRNAGIREADPSSKYIAFLDDDDSWLPHKLQLQINAMNQTGCKMSSTEALSGYGVYQPSQSYPLYNAEHCYKTILSIFKRKHSTLLDNGFPKIWDAAFLSVHNCIITSSVVIRKDITQLVGEFKLMPYAEDFNYWKRALQHTDCVYVDVPCIYYDNGHGGGSNWGH